MIEQLMPLAVTCGGILFLSILIYFGIRFLAYRRSFPLSHRFDFLWVTATLLISFLACAFQPPLAGRFHPKFIAWMEFAAYLISCYIGIFLMDQFIVEHFLVDVSKVYIAPPLRKVIILFLFAVAAVVGVQKIFSINPWAVYAPTSLLSLGIGIAIKDAFQTFFAGVGLSRVIRIGDWIQAKDASGEVVDINWAKTVLRTKDGTHVFLPNSELSKGSFASYSFRDKRQRCRIDVGTSYEAPPQHVKKVLMECALSAEGVLHEPAPEVLLASYGESAIQYHLYFWVRDYAFFTEIASEVSTRVWYAFKRENLEIPFPIRTVHLVRPGKEEPSAVYPEMLFAQTDLFKTLPESEHASLLQRLQKQVYLKGEIVVRQGEPGSSFYFVTRGRLEVLRHHAPTAHGSHAHSKEGKAVPVGELKPGQFFGELSLLTGEPRTATVRALTDAELWRLDKADFQDILARHPDLAESMAEVVSTRQQALQEVREDGERDAKAPKEHGALSRRIRKFFNLAPF